MIRIDGSLALSDFLLLFLRALLLCLLREEPAAGTMGGVSAHCPPPLSSPAVRERPLTWRLPPVRFGCSCCSWLVVSVLSLRSPLLCLCCCRPFARPDRSDTLAANFPRFLHTLCFQHARGQPGGAERAQRAFSTDLHHLPPPPQKHILLHLPSCPLARARLACPTRTED